METKYKDLTLCDYSVKEYESSRNTFFSWADDMCKEMKDYLRLIFKGKSPGDTYEFEEPLDGGYIEYSRIRLVKEPTVKRKGKSKRKTKTRSRLHYVLETDNADRTQILDTSNLEEWYSVLVHLERELGQHDEYKYYEDGYQEWVSELWNDFRDLLQPFFSNMEEIEREFYTFNNPIVINGIKYTRLVSLSNGYYDDDDYDTFCIESSDGKHTQYLEYDNPYLCVKVADKLIAECRKTSSKNRVVEENNNA